MIATNDQVIWQDFRPWPCSASYFTHSFGRVSSTFNHFRLKCYHSIIRGPTKLLRSRSILPQPTIAITPVASRVDFKENVHYIYDFTKDVKVTLILYFQKIAKHVSGHGQ